jgi:hypothetical protein
MLPNVTHFIGITINTRRNRLMEAKGKRSPRRRQERSVVAAAQQPCANDVDMDSASQRAFSTATPSAAPPPTHERERL